MLVPWQTVEAVGGWLSKHKSGLLLLTGPSGSGKTATLKATAATAGLGVRDFAVPAAPVPGRPGFALSSNYGTKVQGKLLMLVK